ncbi:hypothetical protein CRV01_10085 [Arcobacter sp. CECT 8983]|uniref:hypothetical protein n=1 Tax=Arcobacter sp. CECT 8983 TaxID=2044508 RepID=UPI00100BD362|nr:hypothetical protein [Arcobacter sp. CECT 8983]RXJ88961.1 hypothetical protein CRV01_10085 [Arcobacter sp. CECT 8983]
MKILFCIAIITTALFSSKLKYENLLQSFPKNYKLAYKKIQNGTSFYEFIPKSEELKNWTEMITTNIYHRNLRYSVDEYVEEMKKAWSKSCKDTSFKDIDESFENGYKTKTVMMSCKVSKITKKEETMYLKAIKGADSFYTVQKAFTGKTNKEQENKSVEYLKTVKVCDSRLFTCP